MKFSHLGRRMEIRKNELPALYSTSTVIDVMDFLGSCFGITTMGVRRPRIDYSSGIRHYEIFGLDRARKAMRKRRKELK